MYSTDVLQGKVALVTGASKGIGRAGALELARAGAHVVVTARSEDMLNTLAEEVAALGTGAEALAVPADLTHEAEVDRLKQAALAKFPQVDILVNNTGGGKNGTVADLTTADFDWMMSTNVRTMWLCTKAFYPPMAERRDGAVIFVGSVAGLGGLPGETIYCASKHAMQGFAEALDYEARENNVRVSVIAPGGVKTHFGFDSGTRTPGDPRHDDFLTPEEIGNAIVYAAAQPAHGRIFLLAMRPMIEEI